MVTWSYRWDESKKGWTLHRRVDQKYLARTGFTWRGPSLWYNKPIGPITQFNHILRETLLTNYYSNSFFSKSPFLGGMRMCLPVHSGKTIQFFTYGLKEKNETHSS
jgi:hypothetical protein